MLQGSDTSAVGGKLYLPLKGEEIEKKIVHQTRWQSQEHNFNSIPLSVAVVFSILGNNHIIIILIHRRMKNVNLSVDKNVHKLKPFRIPWALCYRQYDRKLFSQPCAEVNRRWDMSAYCFWGHTTFAEDSWTEGHSVCYFSSTCNF